MKYVLKHTILFIILVLVGFWGINLYSNNKLWKINEPTEEKNNNQNIESETTTNNNSNDYIIIEIEDNIYN